MAAGPLVERRRQGPRGGGEHRRGASWTQVVLPKVTVCSGSGTPQTPRNYERTTDPWISFGPDGTLHQISLSFNDIAPPFTPHEDEQPGGDFDHALLASKSEDGGSPGPIRRS